MKRKELLHKLGIMILSAMVMTGTVAGPTYMARAGESNKGSTEGASEKEPEGGGDNGGDNTGGGGDDNGGDNTGGGGDDNGGDNTGGGGDDNGGDNTGGGGDDNGAEAETTTAAITPVAEMTAAGTAIPAETEAEAAIQETMAAEQGRPERTPGKAVPMIRRSRVEQTPQPIQARPSIRQ